MNQVTCKTCKNNISNWMTRTFSNSCWWVCGLEENYEPEKYNPVDGKKSGGHYNGCSVARGIERICGAEGRHWVPRDKKDLFIFLKRV